MATILVVDNEPDIRDLVRLTLELDGHAVITASDGAEALELALRRRPDVVVLDLMMPEKNGWQVLAEMKGGEDTAVATTPVILLSARSDELARIRGGIEGAIRYLTKPFSPAEVRAEVT
ncbi:MAG TPA: response regulator, partial [Acidimicrobiales bacterium]|nr:response regulator [Acidimicrobiales bacterium]